MKKRNKDENYLERIPKKSEKLRFTTDENGIVTLEIENKGFFNTVAQKLFKKPKVSYVHLDEFGSFVWSLADGQNDIIKIGELVEEKFGDAVKPVYERLSKFVSILESYGFVEFVKR